MKDILLKNKLKIMRKSGTYSRLRRKFCQRYKVSSVAGKPETDSIPASVNQGAPEPIFSDASLYDPTGNSPNIPETLEEHEGNIIAFLHYGFVICYSANWIVILIMLFSTQCEPLDSNFPCILFRHNLDCRATLLNSIRQWATDFQISHSALQALTAVLNQNLNLNLPKDPRTLLATPRNLHLEKIDENGSYWHQGLEICLRMVLQNIPHSTTISLNFNVDGLPVYKSSTKNFWPILFNIQEYPEVKPLVIGIYYGISKPKDVATYLNSFIDELLQLLDSGLTINGHRISIKIRCFICDTPARAFIKGVINFNGKYGCIKCTTKGTYSHISRTMVFPDSKASKRTDEHFRAKEYSDHQRCDSPLIRLPIDMVEDIVVADSLHLLELGVMKKLLTGWRTGCMSMNTKWSTLQKKEISELLVAIRFPNEIHRKMRSLDFVALWKGLEYRNFLNYAGIVVIKDYLPERYFNHFLSLFCAVRICSVEKYSNLLEIARSLFNDFLDEFKLLYGVEFMTSNMHNICHVVDEVSRFGILSTISAYPFENCLHSLKKMIKTGPNPLAQIAGRITENMQTYEPAVELQRNASATTNSQRQNSVDIEKTAEGKLVFSSFILTNNFKDKWILTHDQSIVAFSKMVKSATKYFVEGQVISKKQNYFEKPFDSSHLQIFIAEPIFAKKLLIDVDCIFCKLVAVPRKEGVVFSPLMHTIL